MTAFPSYRPLWSPTLLFLMVLFHPAVAGSAEPDAKESWSRFRGPNGTGVLSECNVPLPWQESDVRWTIGLPGAGNSSPVIWNDRFFVMSADPKTAERFVLGGSLKTGEILWKKQFSSTPHGLHKLSSYASSSPCVDAQRVYVVWGAPESVVMKAFTHDGEEVWSRDFGRYVSQHGFGTSPIRVGELVVFANSQDALDLPEGVAAGEDHFVALNARTGEIVWSTPRTTSRVCYGAPCVIQDKNGRDVLLSANTEDGFFALDALTGKPLWSKEAFTKRVCSSAVVAGDLVISTEGSGGGGNVLVAIKNDGSGTEAFRIKRAAPYVPTPVVQDGLAYLWADNGIVSCIGLPNGEEIWSQRIGGNVSSSPVILGDRLVGISQEGVVTILATGRTFKKLGSIDLATIIRATPAANPNALLIRTDDQLLCIGK